MDIDEFKETNGKVFFKNTCVIRSNLIKSKLDDICNLLLIYIYLHDPDVVRFFLL